MFGFQLGQKVDTKRGTGRVAGFDPKSGYCIAVVLDSDQGTIWWCRREGLLVR
ncbi:hypothetical protein ACIGIJ_19090 [Bacillus paranthracis]|uniref:hypothetical protein n=1 Tax=Bacillus paranthracis TaxID=2026186 RepID=UPI0037CC91BE